MLIRAESCFHWNELVLLITGCIAPNPQQNHLYLKDANIRLEQYLSSIKFYIEKSAFSSIVFCENSAYPYSADEIMALAERCGKHFEWISFQGDDEKTKNHGKGHGEGEIIEYALNHSLLLQRAVAFAKVTGRLEIANINTVIKRVRKNRSCFLRDIYRGKGVDTRFYLCDKGFYISVLQGVYHSVRDDQPKSSIEELFYKRLAPLYRYCGFAAFPDFRGVSGGNGINYSLTPRWRIAIYSLLCRINLFNPIIVIQIAIQKLKLILVSRFATRRIKHDS